VGIPGGRALTLLTSAEIPVADLWILAHDSISRLTGLASHIGAALQSVSGIIW
jgi:hypothetical protein